MASLPLKPCIAPGCRLLVRGVPRCAAHTQATARNTTRAGYDNAWRILRDLFITANPTCKCGKSAEIVHHIRPVDEAPQLRLAEWNLKALCRKCHGMEHGEMGTWG